jgi:hypothetical protein
MRFVPYKEQERHPETGEFLGILGTAFSIRESDDGGLSVTWVEHYGEHEHSTIEIAATAFRDSLQSKKLGGKAYFAVGLAGMTRSAAAEYNKTIRIVHAPDGANTGHVELRRFSDDDRRLLDALAVEVYSEHIAVADLQLR